MSFFNQYPYINLTDLNLDYILSQIKEMANEVENFVSINAIKYADPIQWDITSQYEKNTIVIDPQTGTAYISVQPVPSGVALNRTEYWSVVFDLGAFVTRAAKNFTSNYEDETTLTATMSLSAGDWVVWGDVLYRALVNITAGDSYVIGSNIEKITVEDIKNELISTIDSLYDEISDRVGALADLTTTDKSSIVNAINEVVNEIGTLSNLTTTDKSNVVSAINEVNSNFTDLKQIRLYLHDYDDFSDLVSDINSLTSCCVVVDKDMTIDSNVSITSPVHFIGNASNNKLTLNANINVLTNFFELENCSFYVDSGSIVLGDTNAFIRQFNIINNSFYSPDDGNLHKAINVVSATLGNISGNHFYSDDLTNGINYAIYHEQNGTSYWFQNTSITNNTFRYVTSSLYVSGSTNPEQTAGIEFNDNNLLYYNNAIHMESCDHCRFNNNIIDQGYTPFYAVTPNGLKLTNNYIFSFLTNDTNIDIVCNGSVNEGVVISGNYVWNTSTFSSSNITYGLKITTNNSSLTGDGFVITDNYFRNFRYCVYIAFNLNGLMIHSNSFYSATFSVWFDDTNYTYFRTVAYANYIANTVSTKITGMPLGSIFGLTSHAVTVASGSTTATISAATLTGNGTDTRSLMVRIPNSTITGYANIDTSTQNAIITLSSAPSGNLAIVVDEIYQITKYA